MVGGLIRLSGPRGFNFKLSGSSMPLSVSLSVLSVWQPGIVTVAVSGPKMEDCQLIDWINACYLLGRLSLWW